jgi:hypothetical protein
LPEIDVRPAQRVHGIGVVQPITVETMIHLLPIHYNLLPHQNASVTSKQIRGNIPATNPTVTAALKVSDPIIGGGAGAGIASIASSTSYSCCCCSCCSLCTSPISME